MQIIFDVCFSLKTLIHSQGKYWHQTADPINIEQVLRGSIAMEQRQPLIQFLGKKMGENIVHPRLLYTVFFTAHLQ